MVAFNGEIYNYKELAKKFGLKSEELYSDVFVIAHGYNAIGTKIFEQIDGDFVIVIYDIEKRKLFLVRDRLGVKQVVYNYQNNVLRFASEVKAFLEYPDISLEPDINRLTADLIMSFWADKRNTYFKNIFHLPPGNYLELDAESLSLKEYWSIENVMSRQNTEIRDDSITDDEISELGNLLLRATENRLIGEAKCGSLLSGGVDSSILTAMIAGHQPSRTFNAYTILYDKGEQNQDYEYACEVAAKYPNINHITNHVTRDDMALQNLDLITYHMEEVIWDKVYWSMYTNYKKAARDGSRIIINGQGSDEVWLGYYYDFPHYRFNRQQLDIANVSEYFLQRNERIMPYLHRETREKARQLIRYSLEVNFTPYRNFDDDLNAIGVWATRTYLQSNLMQEDRMSMASSVECRVPFTDHRFVEAAFALSGMKKVQDGIEKRPIKEIGKKYLPPAICQRQKMAFVNPSSSYNHVAMKYLIDYKDNIRQSDTMRQILGDAFFDFLERESVFGDPEFSWKVAAIHRFLSVYKLT